MHIISDAMYPASLCQPYEVLKGIWFQTLFTNEAYFHAVLGLTATCVGILTGSAELPSSLPHIPRAYELVNEMLRGEGALEDTTIALVCILTIRETMRGDFDANKAHLDGLQTMVRLRGGLRSFERNPEMLHKICRCDVELSLHTGAKTRFFFDEMPRMAFPQSPPIFITISYSTCTTGQEAE
ncbi:hypothetical protein HYQ45_010783 [Verticillium longisporum]|nr:hypothetical protein HYQ45_010783 [Verticillium longisporum]